MSNVPPRPKCLLAAGTEAALRAAVAARPVEDGVTSGDGVSLASHAALSADAQSYRCCLRIKGKWLGAVNGAARQPWWPWTF
jgi:hypothetical protein